MIIVDAYGGLANRMQVIDSGLSLARRLGRPLHVPWVLNEHCGARPDDLFEPFDPRITVTCFDNWDAVQELIQSPPAPLIIDHTVPPYTDIPNEEMLTILGDVEHLSQHDVVVIRTWARFFPNDDAFRDFVPLGALRDRIDAIVSEFDSTIGVHVRRTDHVDSIRESPTWAFEALMSSALSGNEARSFFLATDDPSEEEHLGRLYPIRVHPKRSRDRHQVEAIQDAVVDLFCLAGTDRVIGSAGSTFSFVAAQIGRIGLSVVSHESAA